MASTDIATRLQAYGERFMRMFDDFQPSSMQTDASLASGSKQHQAAAPLHPSKASTSSHYDNGLDQLFQQPKKRRKVDSSTFSVEPSFAKGPSPLQHGPSRSAAAVKQQRYIQQQTHHSQPQQHNDASGASGRDGAQGSQQTQVSAITHVRELPVRAALQSAAQQVHQRSPVATVRHTAAGTAASQPRSADRASFMSSRTSRVHGSGTATRMDIGKHNETDANAEDGLGGFVKLRREIEQLGASGLDKRDAKAYQQSFLRSLGVKKQKIRIPKNVGLPMFERRRARQEAELDLALESGMMRKQDVVKQRRAVKAAHNKSSKTRGLGEDAGVYKNGLLRVKSSAIPGKGKSGKVSGEAIQRHAKRILKL